jgi:hypothetical protein
MYWPDDYYAGYPYDGGYSYDGSRAVPYAVPDEEGYPAPDATPSYATPLAVGSTLEASLERGDTRLDDGALADDYALSLAYGQTVTISVRGGPALAAPDTTLETTLAVLFNGEVVAQNSAGPRGQRTLVFAAPAEGTFIVRVASRSGTFEEGRYTLRVD